MASKGKSPGILLRNAGIFNPVLVQAVGLCPVVAMATSVKSAFLLSAVAAVIITVSELFASLFLKPVPRWVRIGIYIILGGAMVSPTMILIERLNAPLFGELGIYLPLMAVNSLIVLRCERFAVKIRPISALLDGLTASAGYAAVLILVGLVREILGSGSLLGFRFFKGHTLSGLLLPFGGFIMLGFFGAALRVMITKFWPKYLDKKQPKPGTKKKQPQVKQENKLQTQHKTEPSVKEVPLFTADEAMFTLDDIADKTDESEIPTVSHTQGNEKAVSQPENTEKLSESANEIQTEPITEGTSPEITEQTAVVSSEKDGFRELTIEDLDTPSPYSDSDDELEALMSRSIVDILSKQKREESDE